MATRTSEEVGDSPKFLNIFSEYLRSRELRLTIQRREIAKLILGTSEHLTAEQIMALVRRKNLSIGRSTVYRTLEHLVDCGLVQRLDLGQDAKLYEHTFNQDHHDHFRCNDCGKIFEFECPEIERLQEQIAKERQFTILSHHHEIFGRCEECQARFHARTSGRAVRAILTRKTDGVGSS